MSELFLKAAPRVRAPLNQQLAPLVYVVMIFAAQAAARSGAPAYGVIAQCLILVMLLAQAAFDADDKIRRLCLALALVPLVGILNAGLTLGAFDPFVETLIVEATWLAGAVVAARYLALGREQLGLSLGDEPDSMLACVPLTVAGPVLGLAGYVLLQPSPALDLLAYPLWAALPLAALALFVGFVEIVILYGVLLPACRPVLGDWAGAAYVAWLLCLLRLGPLTWQYGSLTFFEGLLLGWLVLKMRNIYGAGLAHGLALLSFFAASAMLGR